ncbi:MAG: RNA-binding protein [Alphaproteobacteria bacterium]
MRTGDAMAETADTYDGTMGLGAGEENPRAPFRRCIVTGSVMPKSALVRFVLGPGGNVVPDVEGRLPGRGLWTGARRDIVSAACVKNAFTRAARRPAQAPADLDGQVEQRLAERCIDLLGLGRRAGETVFGFDQVQAWLRTARAGGAGSVLISASDAATDGRSRLDRLAARAAPRLARITVLTAGELGRAFGRERIVHVGLSRGRLAARLVEEAGRLSGFRPGAGGEGW